MEENRLVFLGTAGDTSTVTKQIRASGGIILYYRGNQIHIDPGPGSLIQYKKNRINPRNTLALIATTNDLGHAGDLNAVISAMTHDGLDNRGVLIGSKSIIEGTESENPVLWKRFRSYLERNIALKLGERVGINNIDFSTLMCKSDDPSAFGLKIQTGEFTLAYSSDARFQAALARQYEDADILILKTPYPETEEKTDRLNLTEAKKIIAEALPRVVILTGFGVKMLNSDPTFLAREIQRETGVQVIAAHDGLVIDPMQYSRKTEYEY